MNSVLSIGFPERTLGDIERIVEADTDNFLQLVEIAKLDKRKDFIGVAFADMKLDGLELSGFDFTNADFRNCSLRGTVFVECELGGAAFNFPPETRDKWHKKPAYFVGHNNLNTLELMREASEASRKEERKRALIKLIDIKDEDGIRSFLQKVCLDDKAKSLRHWLKSQMTNGLKKTDELKPILERSLFESGEDLKEDVLQYIDLMKNDEEAIETLCRVCVTNFRAIKQVSSKIGHISSFQRTLLANLSYSTQSEIWAQSALALRDLTISQPEKDKAFNMRLMRIDNRYDASKLAQAAAYNDVRIPKLFELADAGYRSEASGWHVDDFLLYCYFYDAKKFHNDVLFYSFRDSTTEETSIERAVTSSSAFAAYCFVQRRDLFFAVDDAAGYFYWDPKSLAELKESFYRENLSPEIKGELRQLALMARDQADGVRDDGLVRPPK